MQLLPVVALVGGTVCLYSAVKNKNPIGVIKAALTNQPLDKVPPLMSDSGSGGGLLDGLPGSLGDALYGQTPANVNSSNVGGASVKDPGSIGNQATGGANSRTIQQGRTVPVGSGNGAV